MPVRVDLFNRKLKRVTRQTPGSCVFTGGGSRSSSGEGRTDDGVVDDRESGSGGELIVVVSIKSGVVRLGSRVLVADLKGRHNAVVIFLYNFPPQIHDEESIPPMADVEVKAPRKRQLSIPYRSANCCVPVPRSDPPPRRIILGNRRRHVRWVRTHSTALNHDPWMNANLPSFHSRSDPALTVSEPDLENAKSRAAIDVYRVRMPEVPVLNGLQSERCLDSTTRGVKRMITLLAHTVDLERHLSVSVALSLVPFHCCPGNQPRGQLWTIDTPSLCLGSSRALRNKYLPPRENLCVLSSWPATTSRPPAGFSPLCPIAVRPRYLPDSHQPH